MTEGREPRLRIKSGDEVSRNETPKLSEDVREGIRMLESETALNSQAKVLLLATFLRRKPASEVSIAGDDKEELSVKAARVETILSKLGLTFETSENTDTTGTHLREYYIASAQEDAATLHRLFRGAEFSPENQKAVGKILGFPETATTAWNQRRFQGLDTLASEAEIWRDFGLELGEFLFFAPSKTFWQDEKKWLRDVVDQIKTVSPTIYEQTLKT